MEIRYYQDKDYDWLIEFYGKSDEFKADDVTDSRENLLRKITRDPESILLALEGDQVRGSVSIIEDGRIAILFRLIADEPEGESGAPVLKQLVDSAEDILKGRGYTEVHNTAPSKNLRSLERRKELGFSLGNQYNWYWKLNKCLLQK